MNKLFVSKEELYVIFCNAFPYIELKDMINFGKTCETTRSILNNENLYTNELKMLKYFHKIYNNEIIYYDEIQKNNFIYTLIAVHYFYNDELIIEFRKIFGVEHEDLKNMFA